MNRGRGVVRMARNVVRILRARPQVPVSLRENALLQVILRRRSVRRFTQQEIPEDIFQAILEAGRLAPSTVNLQTWSFITFTSQEWQEVFARPIPFQGARAVIVVADAHRISLQMDVLRDYPLVEYTLAVMNASLAAMNMNIAAEALGVSSVMLSETGRSGFLDIDYLGEKLGLPGRTVPLMTIVFGYARGNYPPMPPKLPMDAVCFAKHYHETPASVVRDWLEQLQDGYRASYFPATFQSQIEVYRSKIGKAEDHLNSLLGRD